VLGAGLLILLIASPLAAHADDEPDDDIPVVGRPADLPFSGASGKFQARLEATPTRLRVGDTLTLTLTVTATGPGRRPPRRIDLERLKDFTDSFYIESPQTSDDRHPDARNWEFVYRLKPKRAGVKETPTVPFVYYDPGFQRFQPLLLDPIPLVVEPAEAWTLPLDVPSWAFDVTLGPGLLRHEAVWLSPGRAAVVLLIMGPPLTCLAWYAVWRLLYPDAARLAWRRRSRAARLALHRLRVARRLPGDLQAALAAAAVAGYLRQRLDLGIEEPTPAEAADHLRRAGRASAAEDAGQFFRACDAVRFAPTTAPTDGTLARSAERLVLTLEAET
jgi:hypothetical protein